MIIDVEFKVKSRKSLEYNFFDHLKVECYRTLNEGIFCYYVVAEGRSEDYSTKQFELLEIFHSPEAAFDFVDKVVEKYPVKISYHSQDVVEYQGV